MVPTCFCTNLAGGRSQIDPENTRISVKMLLQHFNKRYDFDCSFIETFRKHSLVQLRFSVGPLETVRAFESFKATDLQNMYASRIHSKVSLQNRAGLTTEIIFPGVNLCFTVSLRSFPLSHFETIFIAMNPESAHNRWPNFIVTFNMCSRQPRITLNVVPAFLFRSTLM